MSSSHSRLRSAISWLWGLDVGFGWRDVVTVTWVTWAVFLVTVAVSTADMLLPPTTSGIARLTAVLGWSPVKALSGEWWRLLTSTLTNSVTSTRSVFGTPLAHLIANMLGLVLVGPRLERALGHVRFFSLYVVATIAANVGEIATRLFYWYPNGGSSRSVYALFGAILVVAFLARRTSQRDRQYFLVALLAIVGLAGVATTVAAIALGANLRDIHTTHGGAFIVGLVLAAAWFRLSKRAATALLALIVIASLGLVSAEAVTEPRADKSVLRLVETPTTPTHVTAAFGSLWVKDHEDGTVTRIDPRTGKTVSVLRLSDTPGLMVADDHYLWVTAGRRGIFGIDPSTNSIAARIPMHDWILGIAATRDSLWVVLPLRDAVARIDLGTRKIAKLIKVPSDPLWVVARGTEVWVSSAKGRTVSRIDARSNTVTRSVRVAPNYAYVMKLDGRSLWVVDWKTIYRLDAESMKVLTTVRLKEGAFAIARTPGGPLWATHQYGNALSQIDPSTGRVLGEIRLGLGKDFGITSDDRSHLWVANETRHGLLEIDPAVASK